MEEMQLLADYRKLIDAHLASIFSLVEDKEIKNIAENYVLNLEKRNVDIGFNLFAIISGIYHQENFHSDILKAILDPNGSHNEGDKYLKLFLHFIKNLGTNINLADYKNAIIFRERGKIDILIADKTTKRGIIIENKINNAIDQNRQLPRYLEYVKSKGLMCDAIIYLTLNQKKFPDTTNWVESDKDEIKGLIKIINAYDETEHDLYNGWLDKAEKQSSHIDALLILRQYGALIKHLGGNVMDKQIMDKFYTEMLKGENYKTALSLKSMMDELILFRVENIIDKFRNNLKPFESLSNWKNYCAFFHLEYKNSGLHFPVYVSVEKYSVQFWDTKHKGVEVSPIIKLILEKMGLVNEFVEISGNEESSGKMSKEFRFPEQEQDMFDCVQSFNNKLAAVLQEMNAVSPVLN